MITASIIATILSFLVLAVYLGFYNFKHGTPACISDTWYTVKQKWLWQFFCWGVALPLSVPLLMVVHSVNPLYAIPLMITVAFMLFLGLAPDYLNPKSIDSKLHMPFSIVSALSSITLSVLIGGLPNMVVLLIMLGIFAVGDKKNWLYYIECGALFNIFVTLTKYLF